MHLSVRGIATVAFGVVLACPACANFDLSAASGKYVERQEKSFTTSGNADISLRTFDGSIEVRRWDKPDVQVVIEKRGRDKVDVEEIDVRAEQSGDHITIEVKPRHGESRGMRFGWNMRSASLIVSAPAAIDVKASSGDGSINIDGMTGHVDVRSGDGSIRLGGKLSAVRAHTGDGSVKIIAADGSAPVEGWDITTGDGSITIDVPAGFNADLDAHTGDGGIHMSGVTVSNVSGEIRRNSVRGRLGNGGKLVRLRTGDGSITLRSSRQSGNADSR